MKSQNDDEFNSPRSGLVLHPTDLLPGDALLFRPLKPNVVQRGIELATKSPYSHAAIYLGDGVIADSNPPNGVAKRRLEDAIKGSLCVAVLRSQLGFSEIRQGQLKKFVNSVLANRRFYNLFGVVSFTKRRNKYVSNQLDFIAENYGLASSLAEFSEQSFFCSAFVVACYSVVGIIDETAQSAYNPSSFSPGHLGEDPTFGWLLGYLIPNGGEIPEGDPLLTKATLWRDVDGA